MKTARLLILPFALALLSAPSWGAGEVQHPAHHPEGAAATKTVNPAVAKPDAQMARMQTQMKAMREMHGKMAAAATPAERNALMSEHMKTMQEGMSMMNGMPPGGMGGRKGDMAMRQQMMENHVAMMGATMQMMMDRLPAAPAK